MVASRRTADKTIFSSCRPNNERIKGGHTLTFRWLHISQARRRRVALGLWGDKALEGPSDVPALAREEASGSGAWWGVTGLGLGTGAGAATAAWSACKP
jgi:hypothetical protein